MKVILKEVRIAFPEIFTPKAVGNSEPRYGAQFLFPKDSDNHKRLKEVIKQVALEKFEDKTDAIMKKIMADPKSYPLQSGDDKTNSDGEAYNGYEGMMYLRASAAQKDKPLVLARDKTPLASDNGLIYAGCYVDASVDVWVLDHSQYGKKICAKLLAVRFNKDGDAFGGGARATVDDFEDLADFDGDDEIEF